MYDFRMLHVARLMLEGWVFTSVQNNKKKHNTPTKQNNNKTLKPRHPHRINLLSQSKVLEEHQKHQGLMSGECIFSSGTPLC